MTENKPSCYRVVVYEIRDIVKRRILQYPNIFVKVVKCQEVDGAAKLPRSKSALGSQVLKLRPDLAGEEKFATKQQAKVSRDNTATGLSRLGFTVNPLEMASYSIYVLELHPLVPAKRRFYVGQTSKPVETRIQEHLSGKHSSPAVRRDYLCRREEFEPVRKFSSKWDAESEETSLGIELLQMGFDVIGPQGMQVTLR